MRRQRRRIQGMGLGFIAGLAVFLAGHLWAGQTPAQQPAGEMRWALYVTLSPAWFDPADVLGFLTPFWVLYAMHERVMFALIYEYIWPSGVGPRVEDPALLAIPLYPWSAPLEDVRLKHP